MNKDKTKVLFQKRSNIKDLYPDMWDISVGGHIMSRESDIEAVKRELKEELGIESNNIEFVKKHKEELNNNNIDSKEIVSLFVMYIDENVEKIKLQKEEVSNIKWYTKTEMEKLINDRKVIPHVEEYNLLRDILK